MGDHCSICSNPEHAKEEAANEIQNQEETSQKPIQQTQIQPVQQEPNEDVSKDIDASKPEKKNRQKRVQIVLPVSNSIVNNDKVTYKEEKIDLTDVEEIKKTLRRHFLLSQLEETQINYVVNNMRYCAAQKGSYIFNQGDPSFSYYIILQGICRVIINGQEKKNLFYGDSFGDLGIIYNAPRSASILAIEDCLFAEINQKTFKQITEDLNAMNEKQNRKFLQTIEFYNELIQEQKNALASDCLNETYEEGQVIFNKGDDANSFYIIKEGVVIIKEKNIQLKELDSFGKNCIFHQTVCVRTSSVVAKTNCRLISLNKESIRKNLGANLNQVLQKKQVLNIIRESSIKDKIKFEDWIDAAGTATYTNLKKGQMAYKKDKKLKPGIVHILIGTDLIKSQNNQKIYIANSVIQPEKIVDQEPIRIAEDIYSEFDGFIGKLDITNYLRKKIQSAQKTKVLQETMAINDFILLRKLRAGNFGQVYACYNTVIQKKYAVKVMDRQSIDANGISRYVVNEEEILKETPQHPFLVRFHRLIKDSTYIYIIMELLEGEDMFDTMNYILPVPNHLTRFYIMQILLVLEHLHRHRVIYRDLKPQNLMMNKDGYLKLVDMGTAKRLNIETRFKTSTIIGTPHYMAPEIITNKGYGYAVDLWSLGVIMYEFLMSKLPFGDLIDDPQSIYQEIMKSQIKFPRNLDKNSKTLLNRLLNKNGQNRLGNGYDEIKNLSYFSSANWDEVYNKTVEPNYKPNPQTIIQQPEIEKCLKKANRKSLSRFLRDRQAK